MAPRSAQLSKGVSLWVKPSLWQRFMPEGVFKIKVGNSARSVENYNKLHILRTDIEEIFLPGTISANRKK